MMRAAITLCHLALLTGLCGAEATCVVPGYERLKAEDGDWKAGAGRILFSELSCAACHHEGTPRTATLLWKAGPDLSAVGDRLRASWVRSFLADPAAVKPGTTMPSLLEGMDERKKAELIEDLTHHLMSLRAKRKSTTEAVVGTAKTGRMVFLSVGCVACHGKGPMAGLAGKYAPGELAKFLLSPLAARPAGRMPEQRIGKKDAAHLAAYLAPEAPKAEEFIVDNERAKRGRKAFASFGCAACHGKEPVAKPIPLATMQGGCLDMEPKAGLPRYRLSDEQRDVLLTVLAGGDPLKPKDAIRHLMLQRNCFACHSRDGLGGPTPDIGIHFTSTKDDLGDLGRLPPALDGVGRKFIGSALGAILRGRDPVRTYMRVKMPGFGDELANEMGKLLSRADADASERPYVRPKDPAHAGSAEWGREMVGIKGYACIICHDINGQPSLGIGAYDLAQMPKRLRPEWMRDFLMNPSGFPTGSRMPPFWPGGEPINPTLGGGTTERQIDSLMRYLAEVDESLPPEGLASRASLVLEPKDRPIIFRTFVKGTGTHAIAVGFPGGMNVTFDALAVRWSMAWRGKFIDADGTWNQRYTKMEQPLGEALVHLEEAGALAIVGDEKMIPQFRGYHVTAEGGPVFEYDLGALHVEDRVEPSAAHGLRRTIRIMGQTKEEVQFIAKTPARVKLSIVSERTKLVFNAGESEFVEGISW